MNNLCRMALFLMLANICFSWQIKLIRKIALNDDKTPLLLSGSFAVTESGDFILTDIKDKDNQIKLYDEDGKLIKAWGKMGPGPNEFGGLACLDYQYPYMVVQDAGKQRIHLFIRLQNYEFKKIGEVLAWEANNQIKLYGNNIVISGHIVSAKGKGYMLFMRDFSGKETKYLLPIENRYGANSLSGDHAIREEVSGVSHLGFIDINKDSVFYVSDVRLRIAKVEAETQKIELFGKEPKNFRALAMNKKTRNDLLHPGNKVMEDVLTKFSFVSGIFADKDFVGVIYVNREKKIDNELYFVPYAQIYDHAGNLLGEHTLAPFLSEDKTIPIFYAKDKRRLFLLSIISNESAYEYVIYEYSVEP